MWCSLNQYLPEKWSIEGKCANVIVSLCRWTLSHGGEALCDNPNNSCKSKPRRPLFGHLWVKQKHSTYFMITQVNFSLENLWSQEIFSQESHLGLYISIVCITFSRALFALPLSCFKHPLLLCGTVTWISYSIQTHLCSWSTSVKIPQLKMLFANRHNLTSITRWIP